MTLNKIRNFVAYRRIMLLGLLGLLLGSCFTVKYSFSGASIHPELKTCSVQYFQNRASVVVPSLAQQITNDLKDKIQSQTNLTVVSTVGQADFEGTITGFSTKPMAITGNDVAAQNRFTITVKVKFTNEIEPDTKFDKSFSRYVDYPSTMSFEAAQSAHTEEILELLIEDIFNEAFANW